MSGGATRPLLAAVGFCGGSSGAVWGFGGVHCASQEWGGLLGVGHSLVFFALLSLGLWVVPLWMFLWWSVFELGPCIYYALSIPTELSSR
ncbi:transmembrane protein, putative [Medicago truncatula]|uniref:Transmembrane protein, putative n=1 Tax=Medicago truncatula TaxID=3880 RepID=G7K4L4_MEDTR|nr:transmembrane protein, putative [Medicago truncatula]